MKFIQQTLQFFVIGQMFGVLATHGEDSSVITFSCTNEPITSVVEQLSEVCRKTGVDYVYKVGGRIERWSLSPEWFDGYEEIPGDLDRYPPDKPVGIPRVTLCVTNKSPIVIAKMAELQHPSIMRVTLYNSQTAIFYPRGPGSLPTEDELKQHFREWEKWVQTTREELENLQEDSILKYCVENSEVLSRIFLEIDTNEIVMKYPPHISARSVQDYYLLLKILAQNAPSLKGVIREGTVALKLEFLEQTKTLHERDSDYDFDRIEAEIALWKTFTPQNPAGRNENEGIIRDSSE